MGWDLASTSNQSGSESRVANDPAGPAGARRVVERVRVARRRPKFSTRFVVGLTLSLWLVGGCTGASASPVAPRSAITWSGHQALQTDRVAMSGDYVAHWTLHPANASTACVFYAYLKGTTAANAAAVIPFATQSGDTRVHSLGSDRYYGDIGSSCDWDLTLTPE